MPVKRLDLNRLGNDEDVVGNNAAFRCPVLDCGKVFIVSTSRATSRIRKCPKCEKSTAVVKPRDGIQGGKIIEASIEWED